MCVCVCVCVCVCFYMHLLPCLRALTRASVFLQELSVVLDEETEGFVLKLWRLLIYETEARRLGLSSA
jgi:hypothetical protein